MPVLTAQEMFREANVQLVAEAARHPKGFEARSVLRGWQREGFPSDTAETEPDPAAWDAQLDRLRHGRTPDA